MLLGSLVAELGFFKTLVGKLVVDALPKSCRLSSTGRKIESRSRRGRFDDTLLVIVGGSHSETRPGLVMCLVVGHALVFSRRNDHLEHPFHFKPSLVQKVGIAV